MGLQQALLDEVLRRDISVRAFSKGAGIAYATAHDFVNGNSVISIATADKIAAFVGMSLTCEKSRQADMAEYLTAVQGLRKRRRSMNERDMKQTTLYYDALQWLESEGIRYSEGDFHKVSEYRGDIMRTRRRVAKKKAKRK